MLLLSWVQRLPVQAPLDRRLLRRQVLFPPPFRCEFELLLLPGNVGLWVAIFLLKIRHIYLGMILILTALVFIQDDSYVDSYISTIGVDFVSGFSSQCSCVLDDSLANYFSSYVWFVFDPLIDGCTCAENPHSRHGWEDHQIADCK